MIVQLDVDGVCADFVGGCLQVMRGMGYHFEHCDVTEWNFGTLLPEEQRPEFWRRVKLPGFCRRLELLPGAVDAVKALKNAGHEVRFLTSPMPGALHWREERLLWADHHFDGGHQSFTTPMEFAHDKASHPGDVLVDDKPEHVEAWVKTGRTAILVDQPYNRHYQHSHVAVCIRDATGMILAGR